MPRSGVSQDDPLDRGVAARIAEVLASGTSKVTRKNEMGLRISLEQLRLYERYDGDGDMLSRAGTAEDKALASQIDWVRVDGIVQALALALGPFASEEFRRSTLEAASGMCETAAAQEFLLGIARRRISGA